MTSKTQYQNMFGAIEALEANDNALQLVQEIFKLAQKPELTDKNNISFDKELINLVAQCVFGIDDGRNCSLTGWMTPQ